MQDYYGEMKRFFTPALILAGSLVFAQGSPNYSIVTNGSLHTLPGMSTTVDANLHGKFWHTSTLTPPPPATLTVRLKVDGAIYEPTPGMRCETTYNIPKGDNPGLWITINWQVLKSQFSQGWHTVEFSATPYSYALMGRPDRLSQNFNFTDTIQFYNPPSPRR